MPPRERVYRCEVCGWQGALAPTEPGGGALCSNCGCLVYPRAWSHTWGAALLLVGGALAAVAALTYLLR